MITHDNPDKRRIFYLKMEVANLKHQIALLRNPDHTSKMVSLHIDDISDIVQEAIADMGGDAIRRHWWDLASAQVIAEFEKHFDECLKAKQDE